MKTTLFFLLFILLLNQASGQERPSQTIRGSTIDKSIKTVLSGTSIELIGEVNKNTLVGTLVFQMYHLIKLQKFSKEDGRFVMMILILFQNISDIFVLKRVVLFKSL